jgi:hypothetical protein
MVAVSLEQLQLLEDQDLALVSRGELLAESIWSSELGHPRLIADGLLGLMQQVFIGQA